MLDPTFLLASNDWDSIVDPKPLFKGKYILLYGFTKNEVTKNIIREIKVKIGMPIVALSVSTRIPYNVDYFFQEAGPREFVNLIKYASIVLTGSFHGMAFSLIYKKNFIIIKTGTRMSRMESMLSQFGIGNRIVDCQSQIDTLLREELELDYTKITPLIKKAVDESRIWLLSAIKNI